MHALLLALERERHVDHLMRIHVSVYLGVCLNFGWIRVIKNCKIYQIVESIQKSLNVGILLLMSHIKVFQCFNSCF